MERGVLNRLLLGLYKLGRVDCRSAADDYIQEALGIQDVRTAYLVLVLGFVASLVALTVEKASFRTQFRNKIAKRFQF
jgi:hypothetical protein